MRLADSIMKVFFGQISEGLVICDFQNDLGHRRTEQFADVVDCWITVLDNIMEPRRGYGDIGAAKFSD